MHKQTVLSNSDWLIILVVLLATLLVSILIKSQQGKGGVEEFFTANRNAKWWFLGTSIVATTFASDTPLVITGWVAQYGIAGNWFWWGGAVGVVAVTVFFARVWRSSGVVTDAEVAELRYGGKPAIVLRTSKAFVFSVVVNCIVLGWVFAGMAKISEPFMDWQYLLGSSVYQTVTDYYPSVFIFTDLNTSLTIMALVIMTLTYSAVGGLMAILITDLVWFVLAMSMAIILSYFAVDSVGGLAQMWQSLADIYPTGQTSTDLDGNVFLSHQQVADFIPSFADGVGSSIGIPFSAFILTLSFMWWSNGNVDGAGYIAQRLYSAENNREAEKGALWFSVANFVLRSWPWILAGIAALVIYPRADVNLTATQFTNCLHNKSSCTQQVSDCIQNRYSCPIKEYALLQKTTGNWQAPNGELIENVDVYREDRERGYPALIKDTLPSGLMGLALVALMGAFMSTVSTHINWGASYITNDFYLRFINKTASDKKLTLVSRLSTVGITVMAIVVASFIENVGSMWELYFGMMAGLGLPHLMRWFWWRANAWTELSGMLAGFIIALSNYVFVQNGWINDEKMSIFPQSMANHSIHVICWISLISAVISLAVTLLTPAVDDESLKRFAQKVRPMGFWRDYNKESMPERGFVESLLYFLLGCIAIYTGMFGIGYLLRLEYFIGWSLLGVFALSLTIMVRGMNRLERKRAL